MHQLELQTQGVENRFNAENLKTDLAAAGAKSTLMLPTAKAAGVHKTNRVCINLASCEEINRQLTARHNLYLDTSNAAHTLSNNVFCDLLALHGSGHILFGTDWPWFVQKEEIALISRQLDRMGFNEAEKFMVFGSTICRLLESKVGSGL